MEGALGSARRGGGAGRGGGRGGGEPWAGRCGGVALVHYREVGEETDGRREKEAKWAGDGDGPSRLMMCESLVHMRPNSRKMFFFFSIM